MMNDINMSKMLHDLQRVAAQAQSQVKPSLQIQDNNTSPQSFAELMQSAVDNVNAAQKGSAALKKAFELGEAGVDLPQVMVASQKASIAFDAIVQVRKKLLEAYKDVMSMQV